MERQRARSFALRTLIAVGGSLLGVVASRRAVRWYRYWGATGEEIARSMPEDERVPDPQLTSTRAVSIASPPETVWQWLVQVGEPPRAGFYSYTWIEKANGLDIDNTRRILPEYQELHPGDALDKAGNMTVYAVEPQRHLVLGPPASTGWLKSTWAFLLEPDTAGGTRLVARVRARVGWRGMLRALPPWVWPFWFFIDPGIFVMERKMLLEIKKLAEGS